MGYNVSCAVLKAQCGRNWHVMGCNVVCRPERNATNAGATTSGMSFQIFHYHPGSGGGTFHCHHAQRHPEQ